MKLFQKKVKLMNLEFYLVSCDNYLRGIYWQRQEMISSSSLAHIDTIFDLATKELSEYFNGDRQKFSIKYKVTGPEFDLKVWSALAKIEYGHLKTYKDIAIEIGHPKAYRAVGSANGRNPLSIILPCHRVVRSDKGLGGYAGGLNVKKELLKIEGYNY